MGSRVQCFWLDGTDQVEMILRRFAFSTKGGACRQNRMGYHDERVSIGRAPKTEVTDVHGDLWPHADPRWPAACVCGHAFSADDEWQFNPTRLYRRADTGELMTLDAAPAGAMWNADWYSEVKGYAVVDGITLCVRTPGGDWVVDGPAYPGEGAPPHPGAWTRSGTPPLVTARPSIAMPTYHGFLTNGYLEEC